MNSANLLSLALPSLNFAPRRYQPGGISNWSGHLPFAYDLVASLRPQLIVELGTHYGESYFGFCQSVDENQVPARCYAVDTWHGDAHAGFFGEEVFREVEEYNRAHYSSFSYLLRTTFDQAISQFADESIDLLHIDGFHTYEAVSHDFHGWLPKVRPGGFILLHDIAIRHADFGSWKLWEEICGRYTSFAFYHSLGLGVVCVPGVSAPDEPLFECLFHPDLAIQERVRRHYVLLAEILECRRRFADTCQPIDRNSHRLTLYPFGQLGYGEDTSVSTDIQGGKWQKVSLELTDGLGKGPLRIDPTQQPAIIDIAAITIRSAASRATLWECNDVASLRGLGVRGTLHMLPDGEKCRCFSFGFDPQLLLPELPWDRFDQPLSVEISLRVDSELGALIELLESAALTNQRQKDEKTALVAELDLLKSDRDTCRRELQELQGRYEASQQRCTIEETECARLRDEISSLTEAHISVQQEKMALQNSWPWRVAALFRSMSNFARSGSLVNRDS